MGFAQVICPKDRLGRVKAPKGEAGAGGHPVPGRGGAAPDGGGPDSVKKHPRMKQNALFKRLMNRGDGSPAIISLALLP